MLAHELGELIRRDELDGGVVRIAVVTLGSTELLAAVSVAGLPMNTLPSFPLLTLATAEATQGVQRSHADAASSASAMRDHVSLGRGALAGPSAGLVPPSDGRRAAD